MTVRAVGLYAELNPTRPDLFRGSIRDAVRGDAGDDERAIVAYLNSGIALMDFMEATIDVISRDGYVPGGSSILTDGEWIWRQDLPYYVERYHLALDEAFVRHARDSGYRIAEPGHDRLIALTDTVVRDILNVAQ